MPRFKLKLDSLSQRIFKTKKFPPWIKLIILLLIGGFIVLTIFSEGVQLLHLSFLTGIITLLFSLGLFFLIRNKYKHSIIKPEYQEENVLPVGYSSVTNIINRLEKENDVAYFDYSLVPIIKTLLLETYRAKYGTSLYNTNYDKHLDPKLLHIVKEKRPYKGYDKMEIDLKQETLELLDKIDQV
jgi:hypothetical protein